MGVELREGDESYRTAAYCRTDTRFIRPQHAIIVTGREE